MSCHNLVNNVEWIKVLFISTNRTIFSEKTLCESLWTALQFSYTASLACFSLTYKFANEISLHSVIARAFYKTDMSHALVEIKTSELGKLLEVYAQTKTEPNGYNLINNYIKWLTKDPNLSVHCYAPDDDWQRHGTFIMIVNAKIYIWIVSMLKEISLNLL